MAELTITDFIAFFEAARGYAPFSWQVSLARRVMEKGTWPEVIALPTAAGKTACMDVAIFALASQTERLAPGSPLTMPRRIFFVVDRRIIVDEAYDRACALAKRLEDAKDGILKAVADRLRDLAMDNKPLACFQLRGGICRDNAWARSPIQPTIVTSTVDQMGSRLLFRAYGRSSKAWPIQAGLAGNDSLILLDEAHCAQPFMETLHAVKRCRTWAEDSLGSSFQVTVMSATPPVEMVDVFRDESSEPATPGHPLGNRQLAAKSTQLRVADKAKGTKTTEEFANALVKEAESLADGRPAATVIFVNRVATARCAHAILKAKYGEHAVLLTGRMRPIDRDDTVAVWLKRLSADTSRERQLDCPVFVVATQTLEVGANLDFDVLVTECASLDALRQRFGRLNRMGRPIEAPAVILVQSDQSTGSDDDPVYGPALAATWQWLNEQAEEGCLDMGIAALGKRLPSGELLARLNAPATHAPVMFPAHVDSWAQTEPEPVPTPDVEIFLHGQRRAAADVQVCWRADLDPDTNDESWLDALALCLPTASECLAVPIGAMRRWLAGTEMSTISGADVEGVEEDDTEEKGKAAEKGKTAPGVQIQRVICWRGRDEAKVISGTDKNVLRPGDVVVIPTTLEGSDVLGDGMPKTDDGRIFDWGERAQWETRAHAILRLHPSVIAGWQAGSAGDRLIELAKNCKVRLDEDREIFVEDLWEALVALGNNTHHGWLKKIVDQIIQEKNLERIIALHPVAGLVVSSKRRLQVLQDNTSGPVFLKTHLNDVEDYARRFAKGCGLPDCIIDALAFAGHNHDPGKADPRFQAMMHRSFWAQEPLLAKSIDQPTGRSAREHIRKNSGYPKQGRHELLSVRLLESAPNLLPDEENQRELALHLIASHHGYCRPFAPMVDDSNPCPVTLELDGYTLSATSDTHMEQLDSGVSDRYWRLTRRYGWWGLAWLETILRLADHRASEAEDAEESDQEEDDA